MSIATQKSLALMRKKNLSPWIVERFIKTTGFGIRKDLYNIIDIIGIDPEDKSFIGIQSTTLGQRKDHLTKLLVDEEENSRRWLETGSKLELWSWRRLKIRKKDGSYSKKYRWEPKVDKITLEMLENPDV